MQEIDPYLSDAEIELTECIVNNTSGTAGRRLGSSDASNHRKCHRYLKLFGILAVAVGLLINSDVRIDEELSTSAHDEEVKVKGIDAIANSDGNNTTSNTVIDWRYLRWQLNDTIEDNCIAGYRVAANTTLTCGVSVANNDVTYLTQQHDGVNYCAGVEFQPNSCVEPMFGYWKAPEGNSSEISPLPHRFGIESYYNDKLGALPRCKTMEQYLSNGTISRSSQFFPPKWVQSADDPMSLMNRLVDYDQEYVPATCSSIPLSPFFWTAQASCQTTITMYGDSHIRNLYTATVFGLRGFEMFAEAHANKESKGNGIIYSYEWRLYHDGTADDRFEFHGGTDLTNSSYTAAHCLCNSKVKRCLRIFFVWAPTFLDQRNKFHYVKEWETDLLIVEPGNSYESSTIIDQQWMADLNAQLATNLYLRLGILHFPWGNQPAEKRTEAIKSWVNTSSYGDRMAYMRQDEIIFEPALQARATFHFACGLGRVNVVNDKIGAAEPCTDRQDYSQIRALTTVLFDAFLDKANF